MSSTNRSGIAWAALIALLIVAPLWGQPQTLATGLQGPSKLILTPQGNLLVSESTPEPNTGQVSYVTRAGVRSALLAGLPSGIDVTLAGGSGPTAMVLRERTLYVAIGSGDIERRGDPPTSIHNPAGVSSPLFASVLEVRFNLDIDQISGPFTLTTENQRTLGDGGEVEMSDGAGGAATVSLLARFPVSEPDPITIYRFSNPWGMALSDDGATLWVTDASRNLLFSVDTDSGRWKVVARFPPIPNPTLVGPPVVDAVPTSVHVYGDELLVSFLTGFPFVPGNARILAVHPDTGETRPFIWWLTSATDIVWRTLPDGKPQFFVTEFSANQSAAAPPPGRVLRFHTSEPEVALPVVITPTSMAYDPSTNDLFILELRGQIEVLHLD